MGKLDSELSSLRKMFNLTLEDVGEAYGTNSSAIFQFEKRYKSGNIHIQTVANLVAAMGGELEIVAKFPERDKIDITPRFEGKDL